MPRKEVLRTTSLYLTEKVKAMLDENAEAYGMTKSGYMSMLIVNEAMRMQGVKMVKALDHETLAKVLRGEDLT